MRQGRKFNVASFQLRLIEATAFDVLTFPGTADLRIRKAGYNPPYQAMDWRLAQALDMNLPVSVFTLTISPDSIYSGT